MLVWYCYCMLLLLLADFDDGGGWVVVVVCFCCRFLQCGIRIVATHKVEQCLQQMCGAASLLSCWQAFDADTHTNGLGIFYSVPSRLSNSKPKIPCYSFNCNRVFYRQLRGYIMCFYYHYYYYSYCYIHIKNLKPDEV